MCIQPAAGNARQCWVCKQDTKRTVRTIEKAVQIYNFIEQHKQRADEPASQAFYKVLLQIAKPTEVQKRQLQQLNPRCRERLIRSGSPSGCDCMWDLQNVKSWPQKHLHGESHVALCSSDTPASDKNCWGPTVMIT